MTLKAYNELERRIKIIRFKEKKDKDGNLNRVVLRACSSPNCIKQFDNYKMV